MLLVREIMHCKPGKVRPMVEKFLGRTTRGGLTDQREAAARLAAGSRGASAQGDRPPRLELGRPT